LVLLLIVISRNNERLIFWSLVFLFFIQKLLIRIDLWIFCFSFFKNQLLNIVFCYINFLIKLLNLSLTLFEFLTFHLVFDTSIKINITFHKVFRLRGRRPGCLNLTIFFISKIFVFWKQFLVLKTVSLKIFFKVN